MPATIQVHASHSLSQFLLMFIKPQVVIDGSEHPGTWGDNSYNVEAGAHSVEVFFPYMGRRSGAARTDVLATEGAVARVKYRSPIIVTSPGQISNG